MLYLKAYQPDQYQILMVDSTLYEAAGSHVKTSIINSKKYIAKACQHFDADSHVVYYYINLAKRNSNNYFISKWSSTFHEPWSYIHFFEIMDTDHDSKENIVYKKISYYGTHLFDLEKTTISSTNNNTILPKQFKLLPNFPNPFNPTTTITFDLPEVVRVRLKIFDVAGRLICTLVNEHRNAGSHQVVWNGQDDTGNTVASGLYIYRLQAGDFVQSRKMLFMK